MKSDSLLRFSLNNTDLFAAAKDVQQRYEKHCRYDDLFLYKEFLTELKGRLHFTKESLEEPDPRTVIVYKVMGTTQEMACLRLKLMIEELEAL